MQIGKLRHPLQGQEHVGQHSPAPRVEGVDDQRPHVGVLDKISLDTQGQILAVDNRTADSPFAQSEGGGTPRPIIPVGPAQTTVRKGSRTDSDCPRPSSAYPSPWEELGGMTPARRQSSVSRAGAIISLAVSAACSIQLAANSAHVTSQMPERMGGAISIASRLRCRWSVIARDTVSTERKRRRSERAFCDSSEFAVLARWAFFHNGKILGRIINHKCAEHAKIGGLRDELSSPFEHSLKVPLSRGKEVRYHHRPGPLTISPVLCPATPVVMGNARAQRSARVGENLLFDQLELPRDGNVDRTFPAIVLRS